MIEKYESFPEPIEVTSLEPETLETDLGLRYINFRGESRTPNGIELITAQIFEENSFRLYSGADRPKINTEKNISQILWLNKISGDGDPTITRNFTKDGNRLNFIRYFGVGLFCESTDQWLETDKYGDLYRMTYGQSGNSVILITDHTELLNILETIHSSNTNQ